MKLKVLKNLAEQKRNQAPLAGQVQTCTLEKLFLRRYQKLQQYHSQDEQELSRSTSHKKKSKSAKVMSRHLLVQTCPTRAFFFQQITRNKTTSRNLLLFITSSPFTDASMLESLIDLNINEVMKNNKAAFRAHEGYFSGTNSS